MNLYQEIRQKKVLELLHEERRWMSASLVAEKLGISWNTAKKDLEFLSRKKYLRCWGAKVTKYRFKFDEL